MLSPKNAGCLDVDVVYMSSKFKKGNEVGRVRSLLVSRENTLKVKLLLISASLVLSYCSVGQQNVPVIAVGEIESSYRSLDVESVKTAIESALAKTRKFRVMERGNLNQRLKERNLSIAGIADGVASLGGSSGIDYLIMGRVMEVSVVKAGRGGAALLGGLFSSRECRALVSLNIRVNDVHTGEIRVTDDYSVTQKIPVNWPEYSPDYDDPCRYTNTNQRSAALQSAAIAVGEAISGEVTMTLFPIKVIRVQGAEVYVNYGESVLAPGNYLRVVSVGEGFVDPDTGEVLGVEEEDIGFIGISEVREKYSIGIVVRSSQDLVIGDVAMLLTDVETKALKDDMAEMRKAKARLEKKCNDARRRVKRNCRRDENSPKCLRAKSEVEASCT